MNTSNHLTDTSLKHTIDQLFRRYDKDNNGTLEWNEVSEMLSDVFKVLKLHRSVTSDDVRRFSKTVDANGDGKISKTELYNIFHLLAHR